MPAPTKIGPGTQVERRGRMWVVEALDGDHAYVRRTIRVGMGPAHAGASRAVIKFERFPLAELNPA